MTIINPATDALIDTRLLNEDFEDALHLGVTRIVGSLALESTTPLVVRGENLYLTSPGRHEVFRYFLRNNGDVPLAWTLQRIPIFSTPGQVVVESPETP